MPALIRPTLAAIAGFAAIMLLAPLAASGSPGPVPAPAVPGNALPGPVVDPGTPAATMQLLKTVPDTVQDAHFSVPGQPDITLAWGAHGATKISFWTNPWNIPASYPLGDLNVRISFTNGDGQTGLIDYPVTIIP